MATRGAPIKERDNDNHFHFSYSLRMSHFVLESRFTFEARRVRGSKVKTNRVTREPSKRNGAATFNFALNSRRVIYNFEVLVPFCISRLQFPKMRLAKSA